MSLYKRKKRPEDMFDSPPRSNKSFTDGHNADLNVHPTQPGYAKYYENNPIDDFSLPEFDQNPHEDHPLDEFYRAEGTYDPVKDDELYIETGDIVTLENTFSDGYGIAWNKTQQTRGIVPLYVFNL